MAKARVQQQQMYPGMFGTMRGSRPVEQVNTNDLNQQATKLALLQQQMATFRTLQALQAKVGNAGTKMVKVTHKKPAETITLDEDDDDEGEVIALPPDDDDDGEIVLDGTPEIEVPCFTWR